MFSWYNRFSVNNFLYKITAKKVPYRPFTCRWTVFMRKMECSDQPIAFDRYSIGVKLVNNLNWLLNADFELNPTW